MKNRFFKYYIFFFMTIIGLFSCESDEEFLKENPQTFYTLDNSLSSSNEIEQVLISCYSQARSDFGGLELRGKGSDILAVPERRISASFSDYGRLNPETGTYNAIYSNFYRLISKANTILYTDENKDIAWTSEEKRKYVIAQAKFFRAFAYRSLGELYGGVPIVTEIYTTPKYDFERASRIETYQFAIDDLESSLNDFPETTTQGGRIVKGAAQHYLSELYLAMGIESEQQGQGGDDMYQKAVQYASDVIDGGIYSLMTERFGTRQNHDPGDVYWDLFRRGNVNYQDGNTECIWAFQKDLDAFMEEDGDAGLLFPRYYMPALRTREGFIGIDPEIGARGIASVAPTKYMTETIWNGQIGEGDIRNAEHNIQRNFYFNDPDYERYGELAPDSILHPGEDVGMVYPIWWKLTTDEFEDVGWPPNSWLFRDEYVIRLPETILLRAEAYWRLGQDQNAADDINKIRERAQCDYLVTAEDVTRDLILDERARELFVEERRWNTLLRMGGTVAVDRIREHNYWPTTVPQSTLTFDFSLWPIPQEQIDRNKDNPMPQNPGWEGR